MSAAKKKGPLLQDCSRGRLAGHDNTDGWNHSDVHLGALLRLADAMERIAQATELIRNDVSRGVAVKEGLVLEKHARSLNQVRRRLRVLEAK